MNQRGRRAMRWILVDRDLDDYATKRDGIKISLEVNENLVDLDIALQELANIEETRAKNVEMQYFAGLALEEVA